NEPSPGESSASPVDHCAPDRWNTQARPSPFAPTSTVDPETATALPNDALDAGTGERSTASNVQMPDDPLRRNSATAPALVSCSPFAVTWADVSPIASRLPESARSPLMPRTSTSAGSTTSSSVIECDLDQPDPVRRYR